MSKSDNKMTVFYDGRCPLCNWEISHLKKRDHELNIHFENIHCEQFPLKHPKLNKQTLDALLHVQQPNGQWVKGLDANYLLWDSVGLGKWFLPLKWQRCRPILNFCYLTFAKYRHSITSVLFPNHAQRLAKQKKKQEKGHE